MTDKMITCPCCGEQLHIKISKGGRVEAALFDINPQSKELNETLEKMGYCFGEKEGGEEEIEK